MIDFAKDNKALNSDDLDCVAGGAKSEAQSIRDEATLQMLMTVLSAASQHVGGAR